MHWNYEPKRDDEISVKKGDTVTMVDHHRPNTNKETKRVISRTGQLLSSYGYQRVLDIIIGTSASG